MLGLDNRSLPSQGLIFSEGEKYRKQVGSVTLEVPNTFLSYHLQRRIMVCLTAQRSIPRFFQFSPSEPSLWSRTTQVLCADLQPKGCRTAEYLALPTEREQRGQCRAGRHNLYESRDVGYYWFGRLEHVHQQTSIPLIAWFTQVSTTNLIRFSPRERNSVQHLG